MFKFDVLKTVGSGASGLILLAREKDSHRLFAVKKCQIHDKSSKAPEVPHIEVTIWIVLKSRSGICPN